MKLLSFTVVLAMASSVMAGDGVHQVLETQQDVSKVYAPYLSNNKAFDDLGGVFQKDLAGSVLKQHGQFNRGCLDFLTGDTGAGTLALAGALLSCGVQPQIFLQREQLIAHTLYAGGGGLDPKVFEGLYRPSFQSFNVTALYTIKKKPWWKRLFCCC